MVRQEEGIMATVSRREAGKLILAGAAGVLITGRSARARPMIDSVVRGLQIGAQSYSFRDRELDAAIQAFVECGLGECELSQGHLEPHIEWRRGQSEFRKLADWRLNTPLSFFEGVRKKFDDAGILLYAYNYSFNKFMSDAEIERGFQMARALGVKFITASSQVSIAHKVDTYAQKYKIMVGFHGHDNTRNPDEFSTAETFARAMAGASPYIGVNLDIGHFTAAGGDAVAYLRKHHDKIVTLHIKDRKKNHGANLPFGQGDTPIAAVLRLLRDNQWKIPANIEYEYGEEIKGLDTIAEVKKCTAYCKAALEA
jgi:sugar phosphate isomerase/epimerase